MFDTSKIFRTTETKSVFSRVITLDYYDGPIGGLLEFAHTSETYLFRKISWDEELQNIRIFEMYRIEHEEFDRIVELCWQDEKPNWPIWFPRKNSAERKDSEDPFLIFKDMFPTSGEPNALFLSTNEFNRLYSVVELNQQDRVEEYRRLAGNDSPVFEWVRFLLEQS